MQTLFDVEKTRQRCKTSMRKLLIEKQSRCFSRTITKILAQLFHAISHWHKQQHYHRRSQGSKGPWPSQIY